MHLRRAPDRDEAAEPVRQPEQGAHRHGSTSNAPTQIVTCVVRAAANAVLAGSR